MEAVGSHDEERRPVPTRAGRPGTFQGVYLGPYPEWDVTYGKGKALSTFTVTMTAANMKEVVISDRKRPPR